MERAAGRRSAGWARALAVALAALVAGPGARAEADRTARDGAPVLRVVTFNMLHGGVWSELRGDGERLEERFALAAADLSALAADVIGLQEASAGPRRGNLAARLGEAIGLPHARFARPAGLLQRLAATALRLKEGPAVVSRLPVTGARSWAIDACDEVLPRALVCAELQLAGAPLVVCSTHVGGRPCQARALAALLRARCRTAPLVLAADLNAVEGSEAVRLLTGELGLVDAFRAANPDAPGRTVWQPVTAAAPRARRRVDYLLVAPGGGRAPRVERSWVALDRPHHTADGVLWPSDHYAVVADLALVPSAHANPPAVAGCRPLVRKRIDRPAGVGGDLGHRARGGGRGRRGGGR